MNHYSTLSTSSVVTPNQQQQQEEEDSKIVIDSKDKVSLPSPEPFVTLYEWLIFSWISPLIEKGKIKKLGYRDIWSLPFEMSSVGIRETSPGSKKYGTYFSLSPSLRECLKKGDFKELTQDV